MRNFILFFIDFKILYNLILRIVFLEKVVKTDKEIKNLWYSIRVISGKERTVEENIKYETDANNVDDLVEEIFVPFEKIFPQLNHQHY
jgi:hypothetical protein